MGGVGVVRVTVSSDGDGAIDRCWCWWSVLIFLLHTLNADNPILLTLIHSRCATIMMALVDGVRVAVEKERLMMIRATDTLAIDMQLTRAVTASEAHALTHQH